MISAQDLKEKWDTIMPVDSAFQQLETESALRWHIGYTVSDTKALMAISSTEIKPVDSSKAVAVSVGRRESDGRWTLIFELVDRDLDEVFMRLCCDVVEHSSKEKTESKAAAAAIRRYKDWTRLLQNNRNGLMDEANRKGLIGELLFLKSAVENGMHPKDALEGWAGPEGGDQDFVFADGWHEIKSVNVSADTVTISSLDQLSPDSIGELAIARVDRCTPYQQGAFTLNELVSQTEEIFMSEDDLHDTFIDKLTKYGYIALSEYDSVHYWCSGMSHYTVDHSFPRLTRKTAAAEITDAKYILSISALHRWLRG